ncbi:hemin-degrading factor [Diaphorobacter ruginosibacter]|uniref:Hemin-degrading factor n=1 Tax=Diaphorobacter ruginosibacter TaxID=1715720 RepID=A0A7G9RSD6_9BURK|nr:ChuX/HutX family heme-like substrate-binding protein [Diaphorobacter ruginosibacter]QNN58511.1 hemin-degrading factor [Diaphorobacter ruginosibacter]
MNNELQSAPDATIRERFAARRAQGLRARDAAEALGLSEGAVIAAHAGAADAALRATALKGEWLAILQTLEACGTVMALTRNESTVHEKDGVYQHLSANGPIGLALSREIDLRLFFMHWHAGFAVTEASTQPGQAEARSLQFYDAHGTAVHKVYARAATDLSAWNALVERFATSEATPSFSQRPARKAVPPDAGIDASGLREAWAAMQDTHEFFEMLRRFGAERQQALRLMQGHFTEALPKDSVTRLLNEAALSGVSIMVFVPSPGCIQIHTGPVSNIRPLDTASGARWINVLDKGFNLHLRTDLIDTVWMVRKPTADGIVTSLEMFDHSGDLMAMFFGERKPGVPELVEWRELLAAIADVPVIREAAA